MSDLRVALIGDFNASVTAHQAIPKALGLAGEEAGLDVESLWIHTCLLFDPAAQLENFDGIWCVPASPDANTQGALEAIRFARESKKPYVGTCGGFQHAVIEYARNVVGIHDADHAETNPEGTSLVIAPLSCSLIEKDEELTLEPNSIVADAYGTTRIVESYRCNYGVSAAYAGKLFRTDGLRSTAQDATGQVRAMELAGHPFFVGTLFQPERRALRGEVPPLVRAFVNAMAVTCEVSPRTASRTSR